MTFLTFTRESCEIEADPDPVAVHPHQDGQHRRHRVEHGARPRLQADPDGPSGLPCDLGESCGEPAQTAGSGPLSCDVPADAPPHTERGHRPPVNVVRQQNGLAPLTVSPKLVKAAQIHAHDMAALDVMAHDLPGAALPGLADRAAYVNYNFSTLGENIAFNYPDTASVMTAWLNSPGHRANILGADYTG